MTLSIVMKTLSPMNMFMKSTNIVICNTKDYGLGKFCQIQKMIEGNLFLLQLTLINCMKNLQSSKGKLPLNGVEEMFWIFGV